MISASEARGLADYSDLYDLQMNLISGAIENAARLGRKNIKVDADDDTIGQILENLDRHGYKSKYDDVDNTITIEWT